MRVGAILKAFVFSLVCLFRRLAAISAVATLGAGTETRAGPLVVVQPTTYGCRCSRNAYRILLQPILFLVCIARIHSAGLHFTSWILSGKVLRSGPTCSSGYYHQQFVPPNHNPAPSRDICEHPCYYIRIIYPTSYPSLYLPELTGSHYSPPCPLEPNLTVSLPFPAPSPAPRPPDPLAPDHLSPPCAFRPPPAPAPTLLFCVPCLRPA